MNCSGPDPFEKLNVALPRLRPMIWMLLGLTLGFPSVRAGETARRKFDLPAGMAEASLTVDNAVVAARSNSIRLANYKLESLSANRIRLRHRAQRERLC
jgi:hypothetical protein